MKDIKKRNIIKDIAIGLVPAYPVFLLTIGSIIMVSDRNILDIVLNSNFNKVMTELFK